MFIIIIIIRLDPPRLVKMIEAFQGEREIVVVMEHLAGDDHHDHYDKVIIMQIFMIMMAIDIRHCDEDDFLMIIDHLHGCFNDTCKCNDGDDDLDDDHSGGELFDLVADEEFQLTEGQVGNLRILTLVYSNRPIHTMADAMHVTRCLEFPFCLLKLLCQCFYPSF